MLTQLADGIVRESLLEIQSGIWRPLAKALYVTVSSPEDAYTKVFLNDDHVLVISPADDLVYFGREVGNIGDDLPGVASFEYNGCRYKKIAEDYQILVCLEFGNPVSTEGEVFFWDYEGDPDDHRLLSLGLRPRDRRRADVDAVVMAATDIKIGRCRDEV